MANGTTIRDYLEAAKKVRREIPDETQRIIMVNKEFILDLNREAQLFDKGIDSDGNRLRPYTPTTIQFKRAKGEVYNRTTLLDTGAFYKGFDLLNRNNTLSIFSRDGKSAELVEKYGNIFGLTKENQKRFDQDILKKELDAFISKTL